VDIHEGVLHQELPCRKEKGDSFGSGGGVGGHDKGWGRSLPDGRRREGPGGRNIFNEVDDPVKVIAGFLLACAEREMGNRIHPQGKDGDPGRIDSPDDKELPDGIATASRQGIVVFFRSPDVGVGIKKDMDLRVGLEEGKEFPQESPVVGRQKVVVVMEIEIGGRKRKNGVLSLGTSGRLG
jgi:hypothetical protein